MKDKFLLEMATTIAKDAGLPEGWKVAIVGTRELGTDYGRCCYISRIIQIRRLRGDGGHFFYTSTVLHEVAHALTPGHRHDDVWSMKFDELLVENKLRKECNPYNVTNHLNDGIQFV